LSYETENGLLNNDGSFGNINVWEFHEQWVFKRDSTVWSEWVMGIEHFIHVFMERIGDANYMCLFHMLLECIIIVVVAWTRLHAKERL
jgi:hypothetical protein